MTIGELVADLMKIINTHGANIIIKDSHHLVESGEASVFIRKWGRYDGKGNGNIELKYVTLEVEKQCGQAWTRTATHPDKIEMGRV
jgi:hypothetical protein